MRKYSLIFATRASKGRLRPQLGKGASSLVVKKSEMKASKKKQIWANEVHEMACFVSSILEGRLYVQGNVKRLVAKPMKLLWQ